MKILFSLTYYWPYVSGLTIYVKRLAHELVIKRYQVEVLCIKHISNLDSREIHQGVTINRADLHFKLSRGLFSWKWPLEAWNKVRLAGVVVVNLPQLEGFWIAFFGRIFGKRVVAIYHAEVILRGGTVDKIIEMVLNVTNHLTLFLAHQVITYTESFAKSSPVLKPYLQKTTTIYPPIVSHPPSKKQITFIQKQIGKADIVLGVAARLAEDKGIEFLLQALPILEKNLPGKIVKIAIAGPLEPAGESRYKKRVMELVQKFVNQVVFLGTIAEENMGSFYQCLDVLVVPSILESFNFTQVEAMMQGVPVVTSDLPGARVPIQTTQMGYLVPPKNPQLLASAIIQAVNNKSQLSSKKTVAHKEFAIDKTVDQFIKLVSNPLAKSS